jgi:hypothetical protein
MAESNKELSLPSGAASATELRITKHNKEKSESQSRSHHPRWTSRAKRIRLTNNTSDVTTRFFARVPKARIFNAQ